ncbi:MAG TPA: hypothetical protein VFM34_02730 [Moraxellaceae bacterium]|nr:hypothetical protein [Moraxellaceae bacterium]
MRHSQALVLLLALGLGSDALACGYCIEDKIAAVYDHAQVQTALAAGRFVAYVAVQTQGTDAEATRTALTRALAATPAVQAGSLRFDPEAAAAAFVFDPDVTALTTLLDTLNQSLTAQQIRLGLMRLIDAPGQMKPGT